jgi:hypothetical protein
MAPDFQSGIGPVRDRLVAQMMYPVVKGFVDLFRVGKRKIELTTQITSIISQVVKLVATACKSLGIVLKTYE